MLKTLRATWPLFLGMLLLMASNGLLVTLLTIRGTQIGFSETTIGLMQAGYPVGALVGCTVVPRLVRNVGHVRAFGALASLCSIAAIVHLVTSDPWSWSSMRVLAGFCYPGLYIVAESWLNAQAQNSNRASLLSIYFIIQTVGAAAGQAMVGLPDPSGTLLFGITSILISLSLVPVLAAKITGPPFEIPERLSIGRLFRISPMAVAGAGLNGVAQSAFYVALPLFALASGAGAGESGLLLMTATLAGAAAQFPVGWLSDRVDRRYVVAGLGSIGALACLVVALGHMPGYIFALVAVVGALTLPIYSLCVAHANDHLRPSQIVPASGALVMALNLGILFGAFGGPAIIGAGGPSALFLFLAVVQGLTTLVAVIRVARREAPSDTAPAQAISPQATQMAAQLNPEADQPAGGP